MLLLWSGGCDSTALICDYYSKEPKWIEKGFFETNKQLRTLAISHPQIPAMDENRRARNEVIRRLAARGFSLDHTEVNINSQGSAQYVACGLPQPYLWISLGLAYLADDEILTTGWIRTDDVWHHKYEIECMFGWAKSILGKPASLQFPLEYCTKPEIIEYLKKQRMYSAAWYCEAPRNSKKCKKCVPCITHATALWQMAVKKPKKRKKRKIKV